MATKDNPGGDRTVRQWSYAGEFDMITPSATSYTLVARPGEPATVYLWYDDNGEDSDVTVNKYSADVLRMGTDSENIGHIRDNVFWLDVSSDYGSGSIYWEGGTLHNDMSEYLDVTYDRAAGTLTFGAKSGWLGEPFDITMYVYPGDIQVSFNLITQDTVTADKSFTDLYVGQEGAVTVLNANQGYRVKTGAADAQRVKRSPVASGGWLGTTGYPYNRNEETGEVNATFYAYEHTGSGDLSSKSSYHDLTLTLEPLDPYNDPTLSVSFPVYLPMVEVGDNYLYLPIDGQAAYVAEAYADLNGERMTKSAFNATVYSQTLRPDSKALTRDSGDELCVTYDTAVDSVYLHDIPNTVLHGRSLGYRVNIVAPSHYYSGSEVNHYLTQAVPEIGAFNSSTVHSNFYDETAETCSIINWIDDFDAHGNIVANMSWPTRGPNSEHCTAEMNDEGDLYWSYFDPGVELYTVNYVPYGKQFIACRVTNRRSGNTWTSDEIEFTLHYAASIGVYAYMGTRVEGGVRKCVQNVDLMTPRHWSFIERYVEREWAGEAWKKPGRIGVCGANISFTKHSYCRIKKRWETDPEDYTKQSYVYYNDPVYEPEPRSYVGGLGNFGSYPEGGFDPIPDSWDYNTMIGAQWTPAVIARTYTDHTPLFTIWDYSITIDEKFLSHSKDMTQHYYYVKASESF